MTDLAPLSLLVLAGVVAGLASTLTGLASVVSYPALLAFGLPPVAANVTNTTAMTGVIAGSAAGARQELRHYWPLLAKLAVICGLGGASGAGLLLLTPSETFTVIVPFLVAAGSLLLLAQDTIRRHLDRRATVDRCQESTERMAQLSIMLPLALAIFATGIYAGYFGAAAGIIMLAVLSAALPLSFPVTNALKTIVTGAGNLTATAAYVLLAPVHWPAVAALGGGLVLGGWLGPHIGRSLPEKPLRIGTGIAGLSLAVWLFANNR